MNVRSYTFYIIRLRRAPREQPSRAKNTDSAYFRSHLGVAGEWREAGHLCHAGRTTLVRPHTATYLCVSRSLGAHNAAVPSITLQLSLRPLLIPNPHFLMLRNTPSPSADRPPTPQTPPTPPRDSRPFDE
ncbi:hypothetical protein KGM_210887 [Danaus plexippus plexippus]|uniref:Uncharacterized protein n=1 Tax=Danaus plexippus plexippus TaxID=278856 RepID=A0A212EMR4_DANPL|nr:hypothetical protein KGM_210887 [Danaus plexippus plexippus]